LLSNVSAPQTSPTGIAKIIIIFKAISQFTSAYNTNKIKKEIIIIMHPGVCKLPKQSYLYFTKYFF